MATSGVGGRSGVPVRLGFAAGGVKGAAGTLKPLPPALSAQACALAQRGALACRALGIFAERKKKKKKKKKGFGAAGFKAPGSFPPTAVVVLQAPPKIDALAARPRAAARPAPAVASSRLLWLVLQLSLSGLAVSRCGSACGAGRGRSASRESRPRDTRPSTQG